MSGPRAAAPPRSLPKRCCRCVSEPPARRAPGAGGHPHCVTRQRALSAPAALAYLLAASPSRPHRRPPASSALQSEGGRFVRAQEAGQYFAAGAAVPGGRPSKGRGRGAARASFPYVRSRLVQKRGSPGPRRASSPPAGPPPGSAARAARARPSSRPRRRPLSVACPPTPGAPCAPRPRTPEGKPSRSPCGVRPGRSGPRRRRGGAMRGLRVPPPARPRGGGAPGTGSSLTASRGSGARRRRRDHGRGRTRGSEAAAAAGRPRPAR